VSTRSVAAQRSARRPGADNLAWCRLFTRLAARALGEPDQAIEHYRRALAIAERDPHHDPDELATLRSEMAELTGGAGTGR
jgi:hypothetical protein